MTTPHGLEVGAPQAAIVQGRRQQHAVEPEVGEPLDVRHARYAAPREQLHARMGGAERAHQPVVHAAPAPDARHIEHQQAGHSGVEGGARQVERCGASRDARADDGRAIPQIEREHDALWSGRLDHRGEGPQGRQRLEAHYDPRGAEADEPPRSRRVGDGGIDPEGGTQIGEPAQQGALHAGPGDGVQVGDVALVATQVLVKGARQRDRIALPTPSGQDRSHGRVALAPASPRQHGAPRAQVEHRDHAQ